MLKSNIKNIFILALVLGAPACLAQIERYAPPSPQFSKPFKKEGYYFNSAVSDAGPNTYTQPYMYGSNNASGIISQQSSQAQQAMNYPVVPVPSSDPAIKHAQILQQVQADIDSKNNAYHKHIRDILNDLHEESGKHEAIHTDHARTLAAYQSAFDKVNDMLSGKNGLSFTDACYYTEAAYGDAYMTHAEYKNSIAQSAAFIKKWMQQQHIPATALNMHYAIQLFMGDTMRVVMKLADKAGGEITTHYPFKYDYADYDGKTDYRNYFSTKCLATGTGQCNSMPIVYLQLCEALGVKGYLTFAPFHSFVKYTNDKGDIINYEPTSHWTISDKWYQDNLGVTPRAKAKGIYLDTLNKKQAVANTLVDLAISYILRKPDPDSAFIMKCLTTAQQYFPKRNNVYVYLAHGSLLSRQLEKAMRKHGLQDLNEAKNYADTNNLYTSLMQNESYLTAMGYRELPQALYEEMVQHQKNGISTPDAKVKKSLYKKTTTEK